MDVIQVQHTHTHRGWLSISGAVSLSFSVFVLSVSSRPPLKISSLAAKPAERPAEADPTQENNTKHMLAQQLLA